jgi:membrane associated rhomboid family serine protease
VAKSKYSAPLIESAYKELFPVKDVNRALLTPHINRMLIIVNIMIFLMMMLSDFRIINGDFAVDVMERFSMTPAEIINGVRVHTLFTSMFLHAGFLHLFGNMIYLYIFGDNVEGVFGHLSYLVFYVVCGLAAGLTHILVIADPQLYSVPVIGASGAISGVLGGYLVLYPKAKILTVVIYGLPIVVPVPAILFLGFWFLMQWLLGIYDVFIFQGSGGVAYWAHVGGFIAGLILALSFGLKRKKDREARLRT